MIERDSSLSIANSIQCRPCDVASSRSTRRTSFAKQAVAKEVLLRMTYDCRSDNIVL